MFITLWIVAQGTWLPITAIIRGVIMGAMASQITGVSIVHSTVCSGTNQRKVQSSASLAFVRGISLVTGEVPTQRSSIAKNVSIWWCHHEYSSTVIHSKVVIFWNPPINYDRPYIRLYNTLSYETYCNQGSISTREAGFALVAGWYVSVRPSSFNKNDIIKSKIKRNVNDNFE